MNFAKSIFPLFTGLFAAKKVDKTGQGSVAHLLHFATATVKHELSKMVLKIALAIVASGVLIFSLIMVGRHINDALQVFDNGPLLSGLFFGFVSVVCFASLYLLFHDKNPPPITDSLSQGTHQVTETAEKILFSFLEGLNKGLSEQHQARQKVEVLEDEDSDLRDINIDDYRYSEIVH